MPYLKRSGRDSGGASSAGIASIEFAIMTPLLFGLVLGVVDFGGLTSDASALTAALRAGAEYTRFDAADPGIPGYVTGFTTFSVSNQQNMTVNPLTFSCFCITNTGAIVAAPACPSPGAANPCVNASTNANGTPVRSTDQRLVQYATLAATIDPYTPTVGVTSSLLPAQIGGSITARLQ